MSVIVQVSNDLSQFLEGGGQFFASQRIYQRGNGIFANLSFALPYMQKLGSYATSRVADVVKDTVSGVSRGESLKDSVKTGFQRAVNQTKQDINRKLSGGGSRKRKQKFTDILQRVC